MTVHVDVVTSGPVAPLPRTGGSGRDGIEDPGRRSRQHGGGVVIGLASKVAESRAALGPRGDVTIVGLGYVGLPTALALVDAGSTVIGVDVSRERLAAITAGDVDLTRADLDRLEGAVDSPGLRLSASSAEISNADAVLVCVPTPIDAHHAPDLRALQAACADVVRHAVAGQTLILTSTSFVGTTRELLLEPLAERGFTVGHDIHVAFSPERIDPGNTRFTQDQVPRVVGGATPECAARAAEVLERVAPTVHLVSSPEAAELTKLTENIFRAVNIALANELADVAGSLDLDVTEIIGAAATKPYGFMAFHPGPGVGGHCIPCDPHYLLWQQRALRQSCPVIETVMGSIAARPERVVARAAEVLSDDALGLRGARVLVVGATYKPGVADVRESPAIEIIASLAERGAAVAYHDPRVPDLTLPDGTPLASRAEPWRESWDLVLVHTLHPNVEHGWIDEQPRILDATYRLGSAHCNVV